MAEQYKQTAIIRYDTMPIVDIPTFVDGDCDAIYQLTCRIQLKQIVKSVQNAVHNKHDYVFKLIDIQNLQKE